MSSKTFSSLSYDKSSNMFTTEVEKETELLLEKNILDNLFSKRSRKKDGKCLLSPREWTRAFSKKLAIVKKFCCIAFDRHSLCKKAEYLLTAWFCCILAGCSMKGQLFLYPNMKLIVKYNPNGITHLKNQPGSFKSRNITGSHRENLKQSFIECPFPSREFHKILGDLADCSFKSGNLGEIGSTKKVYKQIKHEGLKVKQKHENIFLSIMELKEHYISEFDYSEIKGFVQFFSLELFVVGLWTEKDIFHFNTLNYAFIADATGSIAFKVGSKMVLYYSFALCDKTRKDEPLGNVEIITDSHWKQPIRNCLYQFIMDEKKKIWP